MTWYEWIGAVVVVFSALIVFAALRCRRRDYRVRRESDVDRTIRQDARRRELLAQDYAARVAERAREIQARPDPTENGGA